MARRRAVLIFSFPEPSPGEDLKIPLLVEKVKPLFKDTEDVKIHLGINEAAAQVIALFEPEEPPQSNLLEHAKRELELIGEDPEFIAGYLRVVKAFADMGHSGGSASVAIPTLNELLSFKNLSPLTDDPNEWEDRSAVSGGEPIWQNKRNPEAFSTDGGKTYYLLSERETAEEEVPGVLDGGAPSVEPPYPVHNSENRRNNGAPN